VVPPAGVRRPGAPVHGRAGRTATPAPSSRARTRWRHRWWRSTAWSAC
jgi:hypothetical protein